ncbi:MAG: mce related protein, partial [Firmicutes bacterium]|nr:mce related protein [Bacillota bacterium]
MTTEAKVGAFTILGLALLTYIVVHLGGVGVGDKGYPVHVLFNEVNGLKPGNLVRYAGVDIGKVDDVHAEPNGARVSLLISQGVKIPDTALISIGADGLMGEKYISISPGAETAGFLKAGDVISGKDQQGLDRLLVTADSVLLDIQKLVQSLNKVFGDERVQSALIDSAVSVKELT